MRLLRYLRGKDSLQEFIQIWILKQNQNLEFVLILMLQQWFHQGVVEKEEMKEWFG